MLARLRAGLDARLLVPAAGLALGTLYFAARAHPASTIGGRGRSPPLSIMEFEVAHGFPSTHAPLPEHPPPPDDAFEFGLRRREVSKAAAAVAAGAAAEAARLSAVLGEAAGDDEAMLVGEEGFFMMQAAKAGAKAEAGGGGVTAVVAGPTEASRPTSDVDALGFPLPE